MIKKHLIKNKTNNSCIEIMKYLNIILIKDIVITGMLIVFLVLLFSIHSFNMKIKTLIILINKSIIISQYYTISMLLAYF